MISNQSSIHYYRFFCYFLSFLILIFLLSACNSKPKIIGGTPPPISPQQSTQPPTATQQVSLPTPIEDNSSTSLLDNNSNLETIEHVASSTPTQQPSQLPTATQPIPLTTPTDNNPGILPPDNNNGGAGISLEQDSLIPPIPPDQLTVEFTRNCPELMWQGTGSDIIVFYNVYRRQINTESWDLITTIPMEGDNRGNYTFCDKTIEDQFSSYEYAISAQDHYGNESNFSDPKAIKQ